MDKETEGSHKVRTCFEAWKKFMHFGEIFNLLTYDVTFHIYLQLQVQVKMQWRSAAGE